MRRRLQEFLRTEIDAGWRRFLPRRNCRWPVSGAGSSISLSTRSDALPATGLTGQISALAAGGQKGSEPARRQLRHRKRLYRAAAARRDDALSGAALGDMARPARAEAPFRPPPCQADRHRSGIAGVVLCRDRPSRPATALRFAPTDWSGSLRQRGVSHARVPFPLEPSLRRSPVSNPELCAGCWRRLGYRGVIDAGGRALCCAPAPPTRTDQRRPSGSGDRRGPSFRQAQGAEARVKRRRRYCRDLPGRDFGAAARSVAMVRAFSQEPLARRAPLCCRA